MSLPSHITAPLIGCATTCAAVVAMGSLVAPLLQGPAATGRSLADGSPVVTLAPALRATPPSRLDARSPLAGLDAPSGLTTAVVAGALTVAPGRLDAPASPAPTTVGDSSRLDRGTPGATERLGQDEDGLSGGDGAGSSGPPDEPPATAPPLSTPATTVVDLPPGATPVPEGQPRRFVLRVVDLEQTDTDTVRVRVEIAPGPDTPASTMTIDLKPSAVAPGPGQAVKVSIDIVPGESVDDPAKLRVRVALVEDTTNGTATASTNRGSETSNVVEVVAPVVTHDDDDAPANPTPPTGVLPDLVMDLPGTTASTGTASTAEGSATVDVTAAPAPAQPAPDPVEPAPEPVEPPAPDPAPPAPPEEPATAPAAPIAPADDAAPADPSPPADTAAPAPAAEQSVPAPTAPEPPAAPADPVPPPAETPAPAPEEPATDPAATTQDPAAAAPAATETP